MCMKNIEYQFNNFLTISKIPNTIIEYLIIFIKSKKTIFLFRILFT